MATSPIANPEAEPAEFHFEFSQPRHFKGIGRDPQDDPVRRAHIAKIVTRIKADYAQKEKSRWMD